MPIRASMHHVSSTRSMPLRRLALVTLLGGALALGAACSEGDADDATPPATAETNATDVHADVGALLAAVDLMDSVGFHGIWEALEAEPVVEPAWQGAVRRARIAAASVEWPAELSEPARAFLGAVAPFEAALGEDDAVTAAQHAGPAHDTEHELSNAIYEYLSELAGIEARGSGH